jgi:zinc D-Ala-D-Ala carboxypeptidase
VEKQLTKNFQLSELVVSEWATRAGIDNTPTNQIVQRLKFLAENLEKVRTLLGNKPISVLSGYRSPAVNKGVKGSKTSQHMLGYAADFICPKFGTPRNIVECIKSSDIQFDQLILEFDRWVHISFVPTNPRLQVLIIDEDGTKPY